MAEERGSSDENIERAEACLFHFKHERVNMREIYGEGYGNCLECIIDYKNKRCKGYIPFYLYTYKTFNQPAR